MNFPNSKVTQTADGSKTRIRTGSLECLVKPVLSNLSISRTCSGKPAHAGYLKRWAALMERCAMREAAEEAGW